MADGLDDELAAFEAELADSAAAEQGATPVAGPRAPKVITAAPVRAAKTTSVPPTTTTTSGRSVPPSEWQPPEQLAQAIQSEFPDTQMPELGKQPGSSLERKQETSAAASDAVPASSLQPLPSTVTTPMFAAPGTVPTLQAKRTPAPEDTSVAASKAPKAQESVITKRMVAGVQWEDKSLLDWPEDDFRIFVGDLGNETNDDVLSHSFSRYPSFQKAKVIRNKSSGKSMGYGFVSFKDPWDMTKALREMHGKYIGNRPVKVRKSTWKERGLNSATPSSEYAHSLAISEKTLRKGLPTGKATHGGGVQKDKRFQKKKVKKGLPW